MKAFTRIFAFYLIALSLLPCGDNGGGILDMTKHLFGIEHEAHSDHEHHNNACGDDDCTPFCICSCCSMALDVPTKLPFLVKYLPPTPAKLPISYSNFLPSNFHHSIWQPPRFS